MDLTTDMKKRELDKVLQQFCTLKQRTDNYIATAEQFSEHGEVDYAYGLIIKEILAKPDSTAFTAWRMLEDAETQYEELMDESKYHTVSDTSLSFAYNMRKQALEIIKKEISPSLETHLGQKIVRMSNSEMDTLIQRIRETQEKSIELLLDNGFSRVHLDMLIKYMEQAKDSFKPNCSNEALDLETRIYNDVVRSIQAQKYINGTSDTETVNQYAGIIEHITMSRMAVREIEEISDDLRRFSQKRGFARNHYDQNSTTPRADYYFSVFKENLYGDDLDLNKSNRSKCFAYASKKFKVSEMQSLAQMYSSTPEKSK